MIHTALVKEEERKQEPIPKIHTRNKQENRNDKNKSTKFTTVTRKSNNWGFCGQQSWSPSHNAR